MAKRAKSKYKASRRLGVNLWGTAKNPVNTKNYPPGQHGPSGSRKKSDYGNQLRAKQQLRLYYGNIPEKQFRSIFQKARRKKGDSAQNLIGLLETRVDILIYRANFVPTVFAARQFVSHKHVLVNGQKINIPSYSVKIGDVIEIREKSRKLAIVEESIQKAERDIPDYLDVDSSAGTVKLTRIPNLEDVPYPVVMEPNLVIEYYSR